MAHKQVLFRSAAREKILRGAVDKDNTTIIGGGGERKQVDGRIEQIRREIEKTTRPERKN